ncbi:MAG TPA: amidohydrolase family protein [Thermoanaerobaculia bacterium]|jgi:imidazolonepropionase-like amidohydrolase|nr:amidohydrolase family protein [Thermoanaerobaculia bacterium]
MNARTALTLLAGLALAGATAARPETVAITGATIHTMGPQGTIQNGTVVIENGKIRAVGTSVPLPASVRRIDAHGQVVTPGLFDSYSQIGLVEVNAVEDTEDAHSQDDRITAAFNVADAINPRSTLIPVNRVEGLTRVVAAPYPGKSLIAGQGAVIDLGGPGDHPGEYLVRSPAAMFAVLGEAGAGLSGGARENSILRLREAFQDTLDYIANRKSFEQGNRRPYTLSRLDLEALIPVVKGELPLVVGVNRASDIESTLRLAKEFHLKLILAGAAEGWVVARQIAEAKVPVLLNTLNNLPGSFESLGATLENPARLYKAGVTIAFMSGDAHNSRNIKQEAGNAVAYGLPWDAALAAMTSVPARIWGIAARYGTLEPGKDADVVIWDGDPLEVTSFPTAVFIRGKAIPMTSRQLELRDRYKDLKSPLLPVYRKP